MSNEHTLGEALNKLATLNRLSKALVHRFILKDLLQEIVKTCCDIFDAEGSSFYLLNEDENKLESYAAEGYLSRVEETYELGEGVTGWIAKEKTPVRTSSWDELKKRPNWAGKYDRAHFGEEAKQGADSFLGIPVMLQDKVIGVLKVENKKPRKESNFSEEDEDILEIIATYIASAVQSVKSREDRIKKAIRKTFMERVEDYTPIEIKSDTAFVDSIDINKKLKDNPERLTNNPEKIEFKLTLDKITKYKLRQWYERYKSEAAISTGGIRGIQNVRYPWDHRFPIHLLGIMLATEAKALYLIDQKRASKDFSDIHKIVSGEVRYNTKVFIDIISRIQAAHGIHVHLPVGRKTIPIWMASFLIFLYDFDGGEYCTASHGIRPKIATKDLSDDGGQYLPEVSLEFVKYIDKILTQAEREGYMIKIENKEHTLISEDIDGVKEYVQYLKSGVASEENLRLIKDAQKDVQGKGEDFKIVFDCVGGCMYRTMNRLWSELEITNVYRPINIEEDPYFHGIGMTTDLEDLSIDASNLEVVKTMNYDRKLIEHPVGTILLITDPDGDRLVMGEIESNENIDRLNRLGIDYINLFGSKVLAVYSPNQAFLMMLDFHANQLKKSGNWDKHNRILIKTVQTAYSWNQWAEKAGAIVVQPTVGFNEIAAFEKEIEMKMQQGNEVIVRDALSHEINCGKDPRMLAGGEESGGLAIGAIEELITSKVKGRKSIGPREKSAGEASIIATVFAAHLALHRMRMSEYLKNLYEENNITFRYDYREDRMLYNENEPDPERLAEQKSTGENIRDKNTAFFLELGKAFESGKINVEKAKKILRESFPQLNFDNLLSLKIVYDYDRNPDGIYFLFEDKFLAVRPSGTDAKIKCYYSGALPKEKGKIYAKAITEYDGTKRDLYLKLIEDRGKTSNLSYTKIR